MIMRKNIFAAMLFISALILSSCSSDGYRGDMGSAGFIGDKTVVVSIFADDTTSKWSPSDRAMKHECLLKLKTACCYLKAQTDKYTEGCDFVCDWEANRDLVYTASFDQQLVIEGGSGYQTQKNYIVKNIDSDALRKKYAASNVIYMFFFNTSYENTVRSRTFPWYTERKEGEYIPEVSNIFCRVTSSKGYRYITRSQSYAHEMMHTFGAPDLYYSNSQITQKYVNHLNETRPEDILFRLPDFRDDWFDFTDVDAYYLGLIDSAEDVEKYSLGASDFTD